MLIIIRGLPGTGKSYFSENLAKDLEAVLLSSDKIRDELGLKGNYSQGAKDRVYQEMFRLANNALARNQDVLLDATFSQIKHLQEARKLVESSDTNFYLIEMTADEDTIIQRVSQSRKYSEADVDVYELIKNQYDAIPFEHLRLDSSKKNTEELLNQAKAYLQYDG